MKILSKFPFHLIPALFFVKKIPYFQEFSH